MQQIDVLREAKELLLNEGWIKGEEQVWDEELERYRYCALGAVSEVCARREVHTAVFSSSIGALSKTAGIEIIHYNDSDSTTLEDVISVFDRTILRLSPPAPVAQRTEQLRPTQTVLGSNPSGGLETREKVLVS